jgi:hypothetical protein
MNQKFVSGLKITWLASFITLISISWNFQNTMHRVSLKIILNH